MKTSNMRENSSVNTLAHKLTEEIDERATSKKKAKTPLEENKGNAICIIASSQTSSDNTKPDIVNSWQRIDLEKQLKQKATEIGNDRKCMEQK